MRGRRGLTLTELMAVIAILGLIIAIAAPHFIRLRERAYAELCAANIKRIEDAKSMWALAANASVSDEPTEEDLAEYIQGGFPQAVVAGCSYAIGDLRVSVACALHSPRQSWADGHLGLSLFDELLASGDIPEEAGNEGWYWGWAQNYFTTADFVAMISTGDTSSIINSFPTGQPQLEVEGKIWEYRLLNYYPYYNGYDAYMNEEVEYREMYFGQRVFPGRPELYAHVTVYPDTGNITYYDYSTGEYVSSTGEIGFWNYDTEQIEYFQEDDIP